MSRIAILSIITTFFLAAGCERAQREAPLPDQVSYNYHIRPILSDNCFACHGPDENKREAGLRLDREETAFLELKESKGAFALVKGDPVSSMVFQRITSKDSSELMPPPESHLSLTEREKKLIGKWIEQGAVYEKHWAFIPPKKATIGVEDKHPIDYFVQQKLEEIGLTPSEVAKPSDLLKRVSFDLTGMPPTLEMQELFEADPSLANYEQIIDELLASPHYGERMAVPWLDAARYADSHGYQDDGLRTMWPWRDWVIHAFNENYGYDQFLSWQIAGDLMPNPTKEMVLATGFNRNHKITQEGGVIDEEYRIEYVTDRTNTFTKTFLGLTFECAKCHDHKFDPISQKDYFRAFAFFDKVPEKGLFGTIDANFADPPNIEITNEDAAGLLDFINKKDTAELMVMVMRDSAGIRPTQVLDRGSYDAKTDTVSFDMPDVILPYDTHAYAANRLGLAEWLLNDKHPLTSRVFVNRLWSEFFGHGLVASIGDFGMQGDLPSHPELLDWLAVDFRENDWDIKAFIKQLLMTETYRQSATISDDHLAIDPTNIYLARMPRTRLNAEHIRDHVLATSGLLVPEIGGPSVKPYQPEGLWKAATSGRGLLQSYIQDKGEDLYRRGMYTFIKRTVPPPVMLTFDSTPRDQCEVTRMNTNTPLQALIMLNDPTVLEASRILAAQLIEDREGTVDAKIEHAFQKIICRKPSAKEMDILADYYQDQLTFYRESEEQAAEFIKVGEFVNDYRGDLNQLAALMQVVHTIYNMEESIVIS